MPRFPLSLAILWSLIGCPGKEPGDTGDTSETSDTADTGDTSDTSDTSDTGDTSDTSDTSDTGDTSDTSDTGDTSDTSDTGDTSDTADTGDTSDTADTGDTSETADTGDTGEDTAASACTAADLVYTAEVRDSAGVAGTTFGPRDALTFVGVAANPCGADVTFTTPASCLVDAAEAVDPSGGSDGIARMCSGVVTTWTVPAGGSVEEGISWGTLSTGSWDARVQFAHGPTATIAIVVR